MIIRTMGQQKTRLSIPTIIPGTSTGLRISAVNGIAFLDNDSAIVQYADGRSRIRIYDASFRYLEAILGAVGTGETYSDLLADYSFDNAASWTRQTGWSVTGGQAIGVAGTASYLCQSMASEMYGKLILVSPVITVSANTIYFSGGLADAGKTLTTTSSPFYRTSVLSGVLAGLYKSATGATVVDSLRMQQVLTPSATGCTLLNAVGAQSFISQDAAFTYNKASYTYKIFTTLRIANPRSIMGVNTFRN